MQIVYLSNRPDVFNVTLRFVAHHMDFIDNAVALVPDHVKNRFDDLQTAFPLTVVTDEDVTGLDSASIRAMDHQSRNYKLRHDLAKQDFIEDEFIMSDDDSRPLGPIELTLFKSEDAYHAYYFHELAFWRYGSGPFDIGQQNSYQLLTRFGYPQLAYASHMPQLINKPLFVEAGDVFHEYSTYLALCEWAMYFNYVYKQRPQLFHQPRRYRTLCWPETPLSWPRLSQPDGYVFENFTPDLYRNSGPFAHFSQDFDPDEHSATAKITAWYQYEIRVLNGYGKERNPARKLLQLARRCFSKLSRLHDLEAQARLQELSVRLTTLTAKLERTLSGPRDK